MHGDWGRSPGAFMSLLPNWQNPNEEGRGVAPTGAQQRDTLWLPRPQLWVCGFLCSAGTSVGWVNPARPTSQLWLLGPVPSPTSQTGLSSPRGALPGNTRTPSATLGIHAPSVSAHQAPDSLCMTVSLVYSSISPWMRRNRGILPLYSCFRIVEYTSSPGHGGRGTGKGQQLPAVPLLGHQT